MKWVGCSLAALMLLVEGGMAEPDSVPQKTTKTETIYIPTDNPPPASAEDLSQPFFAAPSTGNEAMEEIEAHKGELKKLHQEVKELQEDVKMLKQQVKKQ